MFTGWNHCQTKRLFRWCRQKPFENAPKQQLNRFDLHQYIFFPYYRTPNVISNINRFRRKDILLHCVLRMRSLLTSQNPSIELSEIRFSDAERWNRSFFFLVFYVGQFQVSFFSKEQWKAIAYKGKDGMIFDLDRASFLPLCVLVWFFVGFFLISCNAIKYNVAINQQC